MACWLMAKNIDEAWMAWSLKAARNWATSRPRKVRVRRVAAGWNAMSLPDEGRAGGAGNREAARPNCRTRLKKGNIAGTRVFATAGRPPLSLTASPPLLEWR